MAASNFNLNNFLNEYLTYGNRQYTAAENGKAKMEEIALQKAAEAVKEDSFLGLTLSEKLAELGIGDRVVQQLGDTAVNVLKDLVNPITDYLEKYENIFDQDTYNAELQAYGKQLFFSKQALADAAAEGKVAQRFVYDM